mmetsp:Transcript_172453/g.552810  ORF Transcript_172453/g.552810 Transcript_172453/m.552810 type:complete len:120 (+) Transcript_172453:54-413(+)
MPLVAKHLRVLHAAEKCAASSSLALVPQGPSNSSQSFPTSETCEVFVTGKSDTSMSELLPELESQEPSNSGWSHGFPRQEHRGLLAAIRQRFILLGRNADSRSACQTTRLLVRSCPSDN